MGFLAGKRAFIVGVATDRSIAWGIAQAMHREGAELAFSYLNDKMKERVEPLAHSLGSRITLPLDVTVDAQIDAAFGLLKREWGELDIVVHAVAYAPREALTGTILEATTREGFRIAHDVSSYSLTALAQRAAPLMAGRNAALLTLTYLGAVRSIPGYNVMGLAKASLEANVRFLAADLGPQGVRVNGVSSSCAAAVRTRVTSTSAAPPSLSESSRKTGFPAGRGTENTASRTGAGMDGSWRPTKCAGSALTLSS